MTESPHTRDFSASAPLLHFAPPLETRFVGQDAAQGVITGYASIFVGQPGGGPDSFGDLITRSAFKATIAAHRQAGTMPVMLWSHDPSHPVGRWTEVKEDERGLFVRGQLNLQTQAGRDAFAHLQARDITGLSVGFQIFEGGFQRQTDGSRLLTAIELHEISLVAMPAAKAARVTEIKSIDSRQQLVDVLREIGLPLNASKTIAAGGWPALSGQDDETRFNPLQRRIEAALDELRAFNKPHRYR